ncbi:MAG: dihydrodipicolinate synthase family protein [Candidatus Sumerlaeia bacterium]|nr:dihydrodipicolinate synthase family protein [Candidatus Sumerlaeia bacterium]
MLQATENVIHPVTGQAYPAYLVGAVAPLFTPERPDGRIDFDGLEAQADFLCSSGAVSAVIARSGVGRMWSYTMEECRDAFRVVLDVARGRKAVLANCAGVWDGNRSEPPRPAVYRRQAAELAEFAAVNGATAVLQPVPTPLLIDAEYAPQDVILRFFEDHAAAVALPVVLYNQSETAPGAALTLGTLQRLSHRERIAGVIYNTADAALLSDVARVCRSGFAVGTASDAMCGSAFAGGAANSAGPLAAVMPELVSAAWRGALEGDLPAMWRAQRDLLAAAEFLAQWTPWDIGCAVMQRLGVPMAARSRDGSRAPLPEETDLAMKLLSRLRAPYL